MCACGFDLRPRVEDCRFKFWINILDQPLKVDELLGLHGAPDSVLDLILAHDLPVGVDLDLRGRSRLKLYPSFSRDERGNRAVRRRLEAALSPPAVALFDRIERLNVSFDADHSRVLHLQLLPPQQPPVLAELGLVDHPVIARAAQLGLRPHVVSLPEAALERPEAAPKNLYFIPQEGA
jgi:LynF/TruF/PatF family peptide O-prenyltransferase